MKHSADYSGLRIQNGRLINDRPTGMSGIEEASAAFDDDENWIY